MPAPLAALPGGQGRVASLREESARLGPAAVLQLLQTELTAIAGSG